MPIKDCNRKGTAKAAWLLVTALAAGPVRPQGLDPQILMIEPAAPGASNPSSPFTESLLFQAKIARREKNYVKSLELIFDVLLYAPSHAQARRLMRELAQQAAAEEVGRVQEQRKQLLEQARRNHELWLERQALHADWRQRLRVYVQTHGFLEAYDFLYEILEKYPQDRWPKDKLQKFAYIVAQHRQRIELRESRYRDALWGFYFYSNESFPQARASWLMALSGAGPGIAEARIRAYLKAITPEPKPAPPAPPAAKPRVARVPVLRPPPAKPAAVAQRPPAPASGPSPEQMAIARKRAREHYLSGLILYGQGKSAEAMAEWRQALKAAPDDEKSRRALEHAQKELEELSR